MISVVIDRSLWDVEVNRVALVGVDDADDHGLLRSELCLMCCLGFVGLTCGITPAELDMNSTPADIMPPRGNVPPGYRDPRWPKGLLTDTNDRVPFSASTVEDVLMHHNDESGLSSADREARIIESGLMGGIEFSFVGEYLKPKDNAGI